ncbi:hypothetical protein U9M48_013155 [Paspalum notatum var. saurae]|uniref:Uncharacterized protein n=1 Tax=Paspalum notatum var. saurae TaxID=547442 RepID=A0AAQ3WJ05_PASNO
MRLTGGMHVKAHLLNSIRNVWPSECQVLQSPSKTLKICSILDKSTLSAESFGLVSTGVRQDLHSDILARSRVSNIYCR